MRHHHPPTPMWRARAAAGPRRVRRARSSGQSLVEFALLLPLFLTLMLSIIEFGFAFNAVLTVNFASRNAALTAAESGNADGTDCLILRKIEQNVALPTDRDNIERVEIYLANANGDEQGSSTFYARDGGSTTCDFGDGVTVTVPYSLISDGYPVADRCNTLAGCAGGRHLDLVGVAITYRHQWVTPVRAFIGGNPGGFEFVRSNATRMEPVL